MSWRQSYSIERMDHFLARLVGIDIDKLVSDETARRMRESGIAVAKVEDAGRIDDMFGPDEPLARIALSDGRVFVHRLVRSEAGDDWGHEDWELRPEEDEIVSTRVFHDPDDDTT
jgi:hypothetical protein